MVAAVTIYGSKGCRLAFEKMLKGDSPFHTHTQTKLARRNVSGEVTSQEKNRSAHRMPTEAVVSNSDLPADIHEQIHVGTGANLSSEQCMKRHSYPVSPKMRSNLKISPSLIFQDARNISSTPKISPS